jgi:hypothetical protein
VPAEVLDEGPVGEREGERVDEERPLEDHGVARREAERVLVGGPADREAGHDAAVGDVALGVEHVGGAGAEPDAVADELAARRVVVRMRGAEVGRRLAADAERLQRPRVEGDREGRLGERQILVAEARDVDRAVVAHLRAPVEERADALEG